MGPLGAFMPLGRLMRGITGYRTQFVGFGHTETISNPYGTVWTNWAETRVGLVGNSHQLRLIVQDWFTSKKFHLPGPTSPLLKEPMARGRPVAKFLESVMSQYSTRTVKGGVVGFLMESRCL